MSVKKTMIRSVIPALGLIGLGLLSGCPGGSDTAQTTVPTAQLAITLPATTGVAGTPFTFTVTALNATDAVVPTYIGTVHITTSDASATLPANRTLAQGVGKFTVTFHSAGSQTITASDTVGDATSGTSAAISVRAPTYTIGGTITGLTVSGLVLANGSDTVGPPAGATSFVFATALASGSSYTVTVKTQPIAWLCQVANGSGQVGSAAVTNVMVTCMRAWTWVSGANAVGTKGVYGTQGTAAAGNLPGSRTGSVSWFDKAGNLWLFGGGGEDSIPYGGSLNDLWRYSPGSGQWTWISGSNLADAAGVYGTQGIAATGNVPGARAGSVSWIDSVGNLWLFGGRGYASDPTLDRLNDLWRYSTGSGQWTWISGSNLTDAVGVYGTQGIAAAGNVPGARAGSVSWIDSVGNLWLFGGLAGRNTAGGVFQSNDLWRYSPASGQWTWVAGSNTVDAMGLYGTQGIAAAGNAPGARSGSVSWIDAAGELWLFGGRGYDSAGASGELNDLWRYSPSSGEWTWISGSNAVNATGVYGTQGIAVAGNVPGARGLSVSWIDRAGDLWLFGGNGYDSVGTFGNLNDLWRYSPASGQWTWVSGSNIWNADGVYGTQGIAAAGNVPGARQGSVSWIDSAGNLWLFGGWGPFYLNDLWVY